MKIVNGGNCPAWKLSRLANIFIVNCPSWGLSRVGIFHAGNFPLLKKKLNPGIFWDSGHFPPEIP